MRQRDPKQVVRDGYDRLSVAYQAGKTPADIANYAWWLGELRAVLPAGARVLDIGCGCGVPADGMMEEMGLRVTGADISPAQVARARQLVPEAEFLCGDACSLQFAPASFDAIVSFYAIIHIPLAEQRPLLANVRRWLAPGGHLMAIVGHTAWTGTETYEVGGESAEMFWSHADEATYVRWLAELGFEVLWTRFVPEGNSGHSLLLARVPR
jgi:SAM-dependent methyltransferase